MFKAVRMYTLLPGSTETFLQRVQESFVPLISQQAGFLAYDACHVGTNRVRTISTFDTRASAEASVLLALRWAQEHRSTAASSYKACPACKWARWEAHAKRLLPHTFPPSGQTKRWCSI